MTSIPDNPDALLTRAKTADALTEAGYPITKATLDTKATRGGGPEFQKWGPRPLYRWGTSLNWAKARLSESVSSTSELHANPGATCHRGGKSMGLPGVAETELSAQASATTRPRSDGAG
jgi:hypothetical protein